jgi:hypothetical protein
MRQAYRHVGRGSPDRKCHTSSVKRAGRHQYELAQDIFAEFRIRPSEDVSYSLGIQDCLRCRDIDDGKRDQVRGRSDLWFKVARALLVYCQDTKTDNELAVKYGSG